MAIAVTYIGPVGECAAQGKSGADLYRLAGDGSATTVTLTAHKSAAVQVIKGIITSQSVSHNITSATTNAVALTLAAALGNGLTGDVLVCGDAV